MCKEKMIGSDAGEIVNTKLKITSFFAAEIDNSHGREDYGFQTMLECS
jgi:hypothetical protein